MCWGVGTVLFYSLMATKYPLYTFISLVPFSILGTLGAMKALRPGRPRYVPWIVVGPTLLLWIAYVVASFFAPWGYYGLLYVFAGVSVLGLFWFWWTRQRYRLLSIVVIGTMLISSIVVLEGLVPLVKQRSSINLIPVVDKYNGDVYYYNGYSTSVVYYTGHEVIRIKGDSSRWDDKDKLKHRSAEWDKKYLMEQVTEDEFIKRLAEGKQIMVIVPKGEINHFKQSSIAPYVGEYSEAGSSEIYILNKRQAYIEE